jgi:capsular exopolysaccharide synthesis family protein
MQSNAKKSGIPAALVPDSAVLAGGLEGEDLSFRQVIRVVRKRKHIVFWMMAACGLLALIISFLMRPYYSTTATIEIEKQQNDPMDSALGQLASGLGGTDDTKTEIQTQVSVLQSDALAIETMERTRFEDHQKSNWQLFGRHARPDEERGLPLNQAPVTRELLLKKFSDRLTITPIPDTRLIQVTFESADPKFTATVTNALIDQYTLDRLSRRNSSTLQASEWMSNQIADLNKQVETAQQRLIDYQKQSGLIVFPSSASNSTQPGASSAPTVSSPVLDRLVQLNKDLVTAREVRITREAIYRLAKTGDADALANMAEAQIATTPGDTTSQSGMFSGLLALRQQQVALKLQLTSALQTYGAKNPHLVDLDNQLGELDRQIKDEVQRIVNRAGLDYQMAQKAEDGLQKAYDTEEHEANKVNDSQIRLAVLQQEADSTRALYEDLYTKLQESKLSIGTQSTNVGIITSALAPAEPAHPKKLMNAGIGIAAGLFLGVIMAFVLDNLDDTIVNIMQVEELTGIAVLGSIPQFDYSRPPERKKQLPTDVPAAPSAAWITAQPNSPAAEAYRALRTALLLSQAGSPPRTILVTSSLPKEGKSTTTYNLAACFATLGTRVLALDADLRKPSLHKITRNSHSRGLSNLLTSSVDPSELIIQDRQVKNLFLLPAGPTPPNPAELLGSTAFADLLEGFSKQYDLVLIDSPPTMLVADSTIMSAMVDGVMVVLRSEATTKPTVHRVAENFRRSQANLLGFVLNAVDTRSSEYYYAYGYYGGDYYGEESNGKKQS